MRDEKYGSYYGELIDYNVILEQEMPFSWRDYDDIRTFELIEKLKGCGVTEVVFDVEDEDYSDTLFFSTNENTDFKSLLLIIGNIRPDEFSEESDGCYRMWFD